MNRSASIATVWVEIVPETSRIAKELGDALRSVDTRKIGRELGREIQQGLKAVKVTTRADTAPARRELEQLTRQKRAATIEARVDRASLGRVSRDLQTVTGPLARVAPAAVIAPNIVPIAAKVTASAAELTGLLGLIPAAAGAAGLAVGTLKIATLGFADAIKAVGALGGFAKLEAAVAAISLAPNLVPLLGSVVQSVGQLSGVLGLLPAVADPRNVDTPLL